MYYHAYQLFPAAPHRHAGTVRDGKYRLFQQLERLNIYLQKEETVAQKIGIAPCSWGIENFADPDYVDLRRMLSDAKEAGYSCVELGPFGYMPQDTDVLEKELGKNSLFIVGGTLYDELWREDNFEAVREKCEKTCILLSKLKQDTSIVGDKKYKPPYLVIIDAVNDARSTQAGHPDTAPRLGEKEKAVLISNIREFCSIAAKHGVRAVLHPHAGGYIEFADEIKEITESISYDEMGLCLDTGHLEYWTMYVIEYIEKYSHLLDYMQFNDINKALYERITSEHIEFFDGCRQGVMCSIGKGIIDYKAVKKTLDRIGYSGYIVIEQERDPKEWRGCLADITESRKYLSAQGYVL